MLNLSRRFARAFTLVELLVVMGIIVILAGMLLPAVMRGQDSAARARTQTLLAKLSGALELYSEDRGALPSLRPGAVMTDEEQLTCLFLFLNGDRDDGHGGRTVYLDFHGDDVVGGLQRQPGRGAPADDGVPLGALVDGWGHPIRYLELASIPTAQQPAGARNRRTYDLVSPGSDGILGTSDDCANYPVGE